MVSICSPTTTRPPMGHGMIIVCVLTAVAADKCVVTTEIVDASPQLTTDCKFSAPNMVSMDVIDALLTKISNLEARLEAVENATNAAPVTPSIAGLRWYSDMSTMVDGKLRDLSGNGNDAAIVEAGGQTAVYQANGGVAGGGCYKFPDTGAYVAIPASSVTLISGNNPRSICFWIKATNLDSQDYTFAFGRDGTHETFNGRFNSNGQLGFMGYSNDEFGKYGAKVDTGQWRHVCYVYDGTDLKAIADGSVSVTWSKPNLNTRAASAGGTAAIGRHSGAISGASELNGVNAAIDEFFIFDRALTTADIDILRCHPYDLAGRACPT